LEVEVDVKMERKWRGKRIGCSRVYLAGGVPQLQGHILIDHPKLHNIVVEDGRHIIRRDLLLRIRLQQTRLADGAVTDNDKLHLPTHQ
jgi:hypothetical protein